MGNNGMISGILSIISGIIGFLYGALFIGVIAFMNAIFDMAARYETAAAPAEIDMMMDIMYFIYGGIGIVMILIGILAVIGGVYSLKRKYWGLGLAGAIAGTITFFPCGIASIILIAMGKTEFDRTAAVTPAAQPPIQP